MKCVCACVRVVHKVYLCVCVSRDQLQCGGASVSGQSHSHQSLSLCQHTNEHTVHTWTKEGSEGARTGREGGRGGGCEEREGGREGGKEGEGEGVRRGRDGGREGGCEEREGWREGGKERGRV